MWGVLVVLCIICPVRQPLVLHHKAEPVCGALTLLDTLHQARRVDALLHTIHPAQKVTDMPGDPVGPSVELPQHSAPCRGIDRYQFQWNTTPLLKKEQDADATIAVNLTITKKAADLTTC